MSDQSPPPRPLPIMVQMGAYHLTTCKACDNVHLELGVPPYALTLMSTDGREIPLALLGAMKLVPKVSAQFSVEQARVFAAALLVQAEKAEAKVEERQAAAKQVAIDLVKGAQQP